MSSKLIISIVNSLTSFLGLSFIDESHSDFAHPVDETNHPIKKSQQSVALIFVDLFLRKIDDHSQSHRVTTEFVDVTQVY